MSSNLTPRNVEDVKMTKEKRIITEWAAALGKVKDGDKAEGIAELARRLALKPRRKMAKVSIEKIEKLSKQSENIIVPCKVLGKGALSKKFNICALEYSKGASEALKAAECSTLNISEMLKKENIRIIV